MNGEQNNQKKHCIVCKSTQNLTEFKIEETGSVYVCKKCIDKTDSLIKKLDPEPILKANNMTNNTETTQTVTEKIDWNEYDSIITRNVCEKTNQIMNQFEALNDFWLAIMERFVTKEGSTETGRPLLNDEKLVLHNLLTKDRIFPIDRSVKTSQEIYEATRRHVSLNDEPYDALVHAAKQAGVTPDKLLNDILCEHFRLDC